MDKELYFPDTPTMEHVVYVDQQLLPKEWDGYAPIHVGFRDSQTGEQAWAHLTVDRAVEMANEMLAAVGKSRNG